MLAWPTLKTSMTGWRRSRQTLAVSENPKSRGSLRCFGSLQKTPSRRPGADE